MAGADVVADRTELVSLIGLATTGFRSTVEEALPDNEGDGDGAEVGVDVQVEGVVGANEPMSPPASCDTRLEA